MFLQESIIKLRKNYFEKQLKLEQERAEEKQVIYELRKLKDSYKYQSERRKKFTTSKLLMYLILFNCTIVEFYSMFVMFHFSDLSPLYALIGAVIGESLSYAIYCAKSFNESKEEAKNQLERDKYFSNHETSCEEDEEEGYELDTEESEE